MKKFTDDFKQNKSLKDFSKHIFVEKLLGTNKLYYSSIKTVQKGLNTENCEDFFEFIKTLPGTINLPQMWTFFPTKEKIIIINKINSILKDYKYFTSLNIKTIDLNNKEIIDKIELCIDEILTIKYWDYDKAIGLLTLLFPDLFIYHGFIIFENYNCKEVGYIDFLKLMQLLTKEIKIKYKNEVIKNSFKTFEEFISYEFYKNKDELSIAKILSDYNFSINLEVDNYINDCKDYLFDDFSKTEKLFKYLE